MTVRTTAVICGLPLPGESDVVEPDRCEEELVQTESPASTLWCPAHGDVVDVRPSPPLSGAVHLNYGGGKGEWARLPDLAPVEWRERWVDPASLPFGIPDDA